MLVLLPGDMVMVLVKASDTQPGVRHEGLGLTPGWMMPTNYNIESIITQTSLKINIKWS